jgi:hypothetical protein
MEELVATEEPFLARSPGPPQSGRGRTVREPPPGTGDEPAELLELPGGEPEGEAAVGELDLAHRTTYHPPTRSPGQLPAPHLTSRSLRYQSGEVQKLGPIHRDAQHPPEEPDDAVIPPRNAAARVVGGQHGGPRSRVHPLSIHPPPDCRQREPFANRTPRRPSGSSRQRAYAPLPRCPSSLSSMSRAALSSPAILSRSTISVADFSSSTCSVTNQLSRICAG